MKRAWLFLEPLICCAENCSYYQHLGASLQAPPGTAQSLKKLLKVAPFKLALTNDQSEGPTVRKTCGHVTPHLSADGYWP